MIPVTFIHEVQRPWKRKSVFPLGQCPKEVYDHCAHFVKEARLIVIYGGRNHRLFNLRGGRTAFGDIHILNLNYLVWCQVKVNSGPAMERYAFNSFVNDHKLYVFGGLNDGNFIGCNVNRLELIEEEAKYIKGFGEVANYDEYQRIMKKKKKKEEKKPNYDDLVEEFHKKQSKTELPAIKAVTSRPTKKRGLFGEESPTAVNENSVFRGFAAVPDPFLDLINSKLKKKNKSIAKF